MITMYSLFGRFALISSFTLVIYGIGFAQPCPGATGLTIDDITETTANAQWDHPGGASFIITVKSVQGTPQFNLSEETNSTNYSITGLSPGGTYKVDVQSICAQGRGKKISETFQTEGTDTTSHGQGGMGTNNNSNSSGDCVSPDSLWLVAANDSSATLAWTSVEGADAYDVSVQGVGGAAPYNFRLRTEDTLVELTKLSPGSTYKVKVRSRCDRKSSGKGAELEFETTGEQGPIDGKEHCPEPDTVYIEVQGDSAAMICWSAIPGLTKYDVSVRAIASGGSYVYDTLTTDTCVTINELDSTGIYRLSIKATCENGKPSKNTVLYFNTSGEISDKPLTPDSAALDTLLGAGGGQNQGGHASEDCSSPENLSVTHIDDSTAILCWESIDSADHYELEINSEEDTPEFLLDTTVTDTCFTITGLSPLGLYKFRVKTFCDSSNSGQPSEKMFFYMGGNDVEEPLIEDCGIADSLMVISATDSSVHIDWSDVEGAIGYYVILSSDGEEDTTILVFESEVVILGLSPDSTYHVQIKTRCNSGRPGKNSEKLTFMTASNELLQQTVEQSSFAPRIDSRQSGLESGALVLFPNPASNSMQIIANKPIIGGKVRVEVHDLSGRMMVQETFSADSWEEVQVQVGSLHEGWYHLTVRTGDRLYQKMVAIKR